jgi:hypothetical protein
VEIGESRFEANQTKKQTTTTTKTKLGIVVTSPWSQLLRRQRWEDQGQGLRLALQKHKTLSEKQTKAKRAGGTGQVIEYLLVLNSNSSIAPPNKE